MNLRSSPPKVSFNQHVRCIRNIHPHYSYGYISTFSDWTGNQEDEDEVNVWEDNWDDDNVEDDFNQQLRAQLEGQKVEQK